MTVSPAISHRAFCHSTSAWRRKKNRPCRGQLAFRPQAGCYRRASGKPDNPDHGDEVVQLECINCEFEKMTMLQGSMEECGRALSEQRFVFLRPLETASYIEKKSTSSLWPAAMAAAL